MSEENQVYNRIQAAYANLLPEHKSSALFLLDKVLEIVDEVSINFPMATYADNLATLQGCLQLNMKRHEWFVKYFKVKSAGAHEKVEETANTKHLPPPRIRYNILSKTIEIITYGPQMLSLSEGTLGKLATKRLKQLGEIKG